MILLKTLKNIIFKLRMQLFFSKPAKNQPKNESDVSKDESISSDNETKEESTHESIQEEEKKTDEE